MLNETKRVDFFPTLIDNLLHVQIEFGEILTPIVEMGVCRIIISLGALY